jgi:L-ascorbate metabolism protein UlaG (beta-lactamase superfamily)
LRRAREAAIDPGDLADVGLILISHAHRDHLSRASLARLPRAATVIVPPQCGALISDLGFARVLELGTGQAFTFGDAEIASVPVRHSGIRGPLDRRRRGAGGYVIRTQERTVYFAGDSGYFPGFAEIGKRFNPDVALLPIAGYQPAPFRQEHLSPLDALYAFQDLGARILIPIAYGSFELSYEPIDEPLAWLRQLFKERGQDNALTVLDHGQTCLLR